MPVQFTEEDFDQVLSGNFVTKVVYLPNPEYQELALAGVDTLVSTRLDPGVDPIREASRRGAILAVVRLGNKDLQSAAANGEAVANGIAQTGFHAPVGGCRVPRSPGTALRRAPIGVNAGMPQGYYISGVTGPEYGRPMCGTPIGLVGPPHIPLGTPAGLQDYTIVNHTHVCMPEPTHGIRVDVKQEPGYSAPTPPNHVRIVEKTSGPGGCANGQPCNNASEACEQAPACPIGPAPACQAAPSRLARWKRPPSRNKNWSITNERVSSPLSLWERARMRAESSEAQPSP